MVETAKKEAESAAYRSYVADTLYFISHGQAPSMRWHEFVNQTKPAKEEERTSDEIITSMKDKLERLVMN